MRAAALALVLVAGCQDPPLRVRYQLEEGGCGTADCGELKMSCDAVLSLRVLSPSDPDVPHIAVCEPVMPNAKNDLCAIGSINLPVKSLPRETMEIQVTVWDRQSVTDPLDLTKLDCLRNPVVFDQINGFPVAPAVGPTPAFGGRAFYHPGDEEVVVTLGCTDPTAVDNPTCNGVNDIDVSAVVLDFDNLPISVGESTGDRLSVAVGEPRTAEVDGKTQYVLNSADAKPLARTVMGPIPAWGDGVDLDFSASACIQVTEDAAQTTTTLHCEGLSDPNTRTINIAGVRVTKDTVDDVLRSLALTAFPDEGLTLGIVIDQNNNPAAGATVTVDAPFTVEFINDNRTGLTPGTRTTNSGLFVSRDLPYGKYFSASFPTPLSPQIGGLVNGKLTVVVFTNSEIGGP